MSLVESLGQLRNEPNWREIIKREFRDSYDPWNGYALSLSNTACVTKDKFLYEVSDFVIQFAYDKATNPATKARIALSAMLNFTSYYVTFETSEFECLNGRDVFYWASRVSLVLPEAAQKEFNSRLERIRDIGCNQASVNLILELASAP